MTQRALRRFWTRVEARPEGAGWTVALDDRPVRAPSGRPILSPNRTLAAAMAQEWEAQGEQVDPRTMPMTRYANTVLDRVEAHRDHVVQTVAAYGESDLLCYRAAHPQSLVARQAEAWDPLLDWAEARFGARLARAEGVMHVAQPGQALAALSAQVAGFDPYRLAGLHELTTLSGSLILGLAVALGERDAETGWALSRVDETWQAEQWGEDAEAAAAAELKRRDFLDARRLLDLLDAAD